MKMTIGDISFTEGEITITTLHSVYEFEDCTVCKAGLFNYLADTVKEV